MSRIIDAGLEELSATLCRMGELTQRAVSLSLTSCMQGSNDYERVQELSDTIAALANKAEDKVFELIARFQPVASDLRTIKSYMKIAYDFARYGRYALDISYISKRIGGVDECEDWIVDHIESMSENVLRMVRISVDALKGHDAELAKTVSPIEKQVDIMYFGYLDRLIEKASATNKCIIASVLVVRYLERIADHAVYICESLVYIATGEKVSLG